MENAPLANAPVPANMSTLHEVEEEPVENSERDYNEMERESEGCLGSREAEGFVRKYLYPNSDNVENVERYQPGGYHPVAIGDVLCGYEIVHKLGFGGFSTVWLGWDIENKTYAAIKINTADAPSTSDSGILEHVFRKGSDHPALKFIERPIRHFHVSGPNGTHLCTASNVLGPSIAQLTRNESPLGLEEARRAALQLTECVSFLHSEDIGIAHGDLTASNVLLDISNIDHWLVEELNNHLGKIREESVFDVSGKPSRSESAPEYLVEPIDPMNLFALRTGNIKVIDFAESFYLASPPENGVGTPFQFCSPDLLIRKTAGKASDIWALACSIFEMGIGEDLIVGMMGTEEEIISEIITLFGPLPESLRDLEVDEDMVVHDESWTLKTRIFGDKSMEAPMPTEHSDTSHLLPLYQQTGKPRENSSFLARIRKWLARLFHQWWSMVFENTIQRNRGKIEEQKVDQHREAENRELQALYDLLRGAFNYDVEKRLTADQMLMYTWLSADTTF